MQTSTIFIIRIKGNREVNFVNEIVHSSFESAQKPTDHSGSRVNKSMFEKWTEKFLWLIVNNIKEQTNPNCKICQEQRDTLIV